MPVCELTLISLKTSARISDFLSILQTHHIVPLVQARVVRWIILPTKTSTIPLLARNHHWDLLIILQAGQSLPEPCNRLIAASWSCSCGIPSKITSSFYSKNQSLLHPPPGSVPPAQKPKSNAQSTQSLALSPELSSWIASLSDIERTHPISMLNLLSFNPEPSAREAYKRYGAAFASSAGSRHGGNAKIVGHVVGGQAKEDGWDEFALAHYPSLEHFAAMVGSDDYQSVNQGERLKALNDTFILCTMEINGKGELIAPKRGANINTKSVL